MHFSEELVGRYRATRQPLASAMLGGDASQLTCIANDFGFDHIFARPLEALGRAGDMLLVLSTSGNSPNIVSALEVARTRSIQTAGLLGGTGGQCQTICDECIVIEETDSACIQDAHQVIIHLLCEHIEQWACANAAEVTL